MDNTILVTLCLVLAVSVAHAQLEDGEVILIHLWGFYSKFKLTFFSHF